MRISAILLAGMTVLLATTSALPAPASEVVSPSLARGLKSKFGIARSLRGEEQDASDDREDEERGVADIAHKLKLSTVGQKIATWDDQQKIKLAVQMIAKEGTTLEHLYQKKITPDQLYKALGLEKLMKHAYDTGPYLYKAMQRTPQYKLWQKYNDLWLSMKSRARERVMLF